MIPFIRFSKSHNMFGACNNEKNLNSENMGQNKMVPCAKSFSYTLDSFTGKEMWTNLSSKHNVTSVGRQRALYWT